MLGLELVDDACPGQLGEDRTPPRLVDAFRVGASCHVRIVRARRDGYGGWVKITELNLPEPLPSTIRVALDRIDETEDASVIVDSHTNGYPRLLLIATPLRPPRIVRPPDHLWALA